MVVKDADARLGGKDLSEVRAHPYFEGVSFERAHTKPRPVASLAELCLQRLGRNLKDNFEPLLAEFKGRTTHCPHLWEVIERMRLTQKWQDDILPPEEGDDCDSHAR